MTKDEKSNNKIKLLIFGDTPACATGFSSVIRGIFKNLAKTGRYDITIYGVNELGGWKDPEEHPYKIFPAMLQGDTDYYGRVRFMDVLRGADLQIKPSWDIVFTLNDPFIFEQQLFPFDFGLMKAIGNIQALYYKQARPDLWWKLVSYWPVDSSLKGNWVENAISLPDYSIAYTNYGKSEIEKADRKLTKPTYKNIDVIYHGTDTDSFFPMTKEEKSAFRKQFFKGKISDETFVVSIIARNQMRKDIPRAMKIFREFQKRRPDSFLYIHAMETDVWGSLKEYARNFNLEFGKDWTYPANFTANKGFPLSGLNKLYNVSNLQLQTTLGEGWCLPITEAMACKIPNIAPNITSISEIFNTVGKKFTGVNELEKDETIRGIPLLSGSTSSEWATYGPTDYERVRPLTNVDDAITKLLWAYDHSEVLTKIADRAYNWVQQYSWKKVSEAWDSYFQSVYNGLVEERKKPKDVVKKDTSSKDKTEPVKSQ